MKTRLILRENGTGKIIIPIHSGHVNSGISIWCRRRLEAKWMLVKQNSRKGNQSLDLVFISEIEGLLLFYQKIRYSLGDLIHFRKCYIYTLTQGESFKNGKQFFSQSFKNNKKIYFSERNTRLHDGNNPNLLGWCVFFCSSGSANGKVSLDF